jgi:hypothetical protein
MPSQPQPRHTSPERSRENTKRGEEAVVDNLSNDFVRDERNKGKEDVRKGDIAQKALSGDHLESQGGVRQARQLSNPLPVSHGAASAVISAFMMIVKGNKNSVEKSIPRRAKLKNGNHGKSLPNHY